MILIAKANSYLTDDNDESERGKKKKKNGKKNWVVKRKFKLENYKNCLKATQLENKIIHLNNNKIDVKRIISSRKEFITNEKVILKSRQKYKSENHNGFTEEISKNGLQMMIKEYNRLIH